MKKRYKLLIGAAAFTALAALINEYVRARFSEPISKEYKEHTYSWRFGNIKYIKTGKGKPLLLLHGLGPGFGAHEWDQSVDMLSRHFTVYAPDLVGFGNSDKPAISYSPYLYASLIRDFAENVIGEPCYAAASGLSAGFVLQSAKLSPNSFMKLMLISPDAGDYEKYCPYFGKFLEFPVYGTFAFNVIGSIAHLSHYLSKRGVFPESVSFSDIAYKYHRSAHYGGGKFSLAALISGHLCTDMGKVIGASSVPIRMVFGEEDNMAAFKDNLSCGESANPLTFSVIDGTGNFPHCHRPLSFARLCAGFFK